MNAQAIRESFASSTGSINHEFSQEVIDECKHEIQDTLERVIRGETTWENEEVKLLAEWNKLHPK